MSTIIPYDPHNPHRAQNLNYKRTRKDHRLSITQWHRAGWTHSMICDGLTEKGLQISISQVQPLLSSMGLNRFNKGQPIRHDQSSMASVGDVEPRNSSDSTRGQPVQEGELGITGSSNRSNGESQVFGRQQTGATAVSRHLHESFDGNVNSYEHNETRYSQSSADDASSLHTSFDKAEQNVIEVVLYDGLESEDADFFEFERISQGNLSTAAVSSQDPKDDSEKCTTDHDSTKTRPCEEDDFDEVTGMPPALSLTEATSITARNELVNDLRIQTPAFFKIGLVFATGVPKHKPHDLHQDGPASTVNSHTIRVWLVAIKDAKFCSCFRIRTYQGNGIKHLRADQEIQSLLRDQEKRAIQLEAVQKDIDAHAIVYPDDRSAYHDEGEPYMKKKALAVKLDLGLRHDLVDRMSRACFSRPWQIAYSEKVAPIGRLVDSSMPYLEKFTAELFCEPRQGAA